MSITRITRILLAGVLLMACSSENEETPPPPPPPIRPAVSELKVMSFNIWRSGGQSLPQTIAAIRGAGADIVGLQECNAETAGTIARDLGVQEVHDDNGHAILSRFPIASTIASTKDVWGGFGASITLSDTQRVHVFDAHLHYDQYGPYFLQDGKSAAFILEREGAMRMPGLTELLDNIDPFLRLNEPTFLLGDFNAPSHLDYTDFAWPESLACYARGFADSYRVVHPQNRKYPTPFAFDEPGITWTPITSEEVRGAFDRIDFIYFSFGTTQVTPTASSELDGRNSVQPWPSDHRAVLSTFSLR